MSSSNIKVAFLVDSLRAGGAERVVSLLANQLAKESYRVSVITFKGKDSDYFSLREEVKREVVPWEGFLSIKSFLKKLNFILSSYSVVISFMDQANIFALLSQKKVPVIISERNYPEYTSLYQKFSKYRLGKVFLWLKYVIYKKACFIVLQTERSREFFPAFLQDKIKVIPNPVCPPAGEGNLTLKKPYILGVGRLSKQKNFSLLIKAFKEASRTFKDWYLYIIGEGEEKQNLSQLIEELQLSQRVKLLGVVPDLLGAMTGAEIFALSSLAEGQPMVLGEAMFLGKAVIATDCPTGPKELITPNQDGILVQNNNLTQFKENLLKLMSSQELRKQLGLSAKKKAEKYCIENCPTGALEIDIQTGAIKVDEESCIGCGVCVRV
ncbi:MAG: glycosyltransferase, partial [Candidatus Dadabacteria bacterium]